MRFVQTLEKGEALLDELLVKAASAASGEQKARSRALLFLLALSACSLCLLSHS